MRKNKMFKNVITIVLIAFALITIFMSSSVLFDWFEMRAKGGIYIPFLVKTNLTAGFICLIVAYGFIKSQNWAFWAMISVALLIFYALILSYVHIHTGGLYENKIIIVMIVRVLFTLMLAGFIYGFTNKEE